MTRIPAKIAFLEFVYQDPAVEVQTEQRTVEHETIDDDVIIQVMGRKPSSITIEGVVLENEVTAIDSLTKLDVVDLRSERWSGEVIITSTSTSFKRAKASNSLWLYDASIECIAVERADGSRGDDLVTAGAAQAGDAGSGVAAAADESGSEGLDIQASLTEIRGDR